MLLSEDRFPFLLHCELEHNSIKFNDMVKKGIDGQKGEFPAGMETTDEAIYCPTDCSRRIPFLTTSN